MIQILVLTNKTRSLERPPLLSLLQRTPAGSKLLAEMKSKAVKQTRKPARPVHHSSTKQPVKKPASPSPQQPSPAVRSNPAASQPKPMDRKPVQNTPVNGQSVNRPADTPKPAMPPVTSKPANQPPVTQLPELRFPGTNGNGKALNGTNGNGLKDKKNGYSYNGTNGNGTAAQPPMFRPGFFSSIPTTKTAPKADTPVQEPLENPARPVSSLTGNDRPPENEKPPVVESKPRTEAKPDTLRIEHQQVPTLDQILKENRGLPAQSAVLGIGEDGLPVLIDLNEPDPGALVIIGDERLEQLEILRTAVASLAGRNSARGVQVLVFSCDPQPWKDWLSERGFDRHILGVVGVEDETDIRDWIIQLADWTEQRRLGQRSGPPVLLVMDTLSFLNRLEYDVRMNFDWMAKEGPPALIWPIAAISTDLARMLSTRRMLRGFQTRILGYAENPADYIQINGLTDQEAAGFHRAGEFAVHVGDDWLRFRLPASESPRRSGRRG